MWFQNLVWNFKGHLWNFTQNFEPIHRKICILLFSIFCMWFTTSLNCDVISLSETGPVRQGPRVLWQQTTKNRSESLLRYVISNFTAQTSVCCSYGAERESHNEKISHRNVRRSSKNEACLHGVYFTSVDVMLFFFNINELSILPEILPLIGV